MNTITLTRIHSAVNRTDRDTVAWAYIQGQSLEVIRESLPLEVMFAASLNGVTIPEDRFCEIFPRPGDQLLFVPIISGGSDGKMIGRIVAMVVIAVAAAYTGGLAADAYGPMAGAVVSAGVMLVGGLLVNAILPPPKSTAAGTTDLATTSQAYSWSPQTLQEQGITIPRWYGENKLTGNIVDGYLQSDGALQYLNAIISLGVGPFADIPYDTIQINKQPLANFQGVPNVEMKYGWLDQMAMSAVPSTIVEHSLSQLISSVTPYLYTPSGSTYDFLEVELTFPNGLYNINATTGVYGSQSVEVTIELLNGSNSITLTETRVATQIIKSGWSLGYFAFSRRRLANEAATWVEITAGESDYGSTNYEGGVGVSPYHVEGEVVDSSIGSYWHYFNNESSGTTVSFVPYTTFTGTAQTVIRQSFKNTGMVHGTWQVRITRLTADNTLTTISDKCYVSAVREIYAVSLQYPRQAMVAIHSLATDTLSGSLAFSVVAKCLYIRVWNGTSWSVQYSNNPAWVLFDVLTQPVYSGDSFFNIPSFTVIRYDGINPSRLDYIKFKEWADYCDEMVSDGVGGTEKRITFNGGFDAETNLWDAAMRVCQVGGAILVWQGVTLTLAIDKPSTPVQLFSVGNTGVDSFSEVFLSMEDRAAEIEVDFINSENEWVGDKVSVVNSNIKTIASKVSLQLIGINKASEAWRVAHRRLLYNELITRTVTFTADIDAIACTVGDVILLQSDVPQWGLGGRLVSATTTSLVLDQKVVIAPATSYSVMIRMSDDTLVERTISNAPGTTNTLTVASPFSTAPAQYDVYAFGISAIESKPFRVSTIQRSGDLVATISCVEYNANIYLESDPVLPPINYANNYPVPAYAPIFQSVLNLTLSEYMRKRSGGFVDTVLTVLWEPPINQFVFYRVEVLYSSGSQPLTRNGRSNGDFISLGEYPVGQGCAEIPVLDGLTYEVIVRVLNVMGDKQPFEQAASASHYVIGKTSPPQDVTQFTLQGDVLSWNPVSDVDLAGYEIRYHYGTNTSWGDAVMMCQGLITSSPHQPVVVPYGELTVMIKAVDTTGNYSLNAASIVAVLRLLVDQFGDPVVANVIESVDFSALGWPVFGFTMWHTETSQLMWSLSDSSPMWLSALINGAIAGGYPTATDMSGQMWNPNDTSDQWTNDGSIFMQNLAYADMQYTFSVNFGHNVIGGRILLSTSIQGNAVSLQYRPQGPNAKWSIQPDNPMWVDDTLNMWRVPNFMPWPGEVAATDDTYDFQVFTGFGQIQGIISALQVIVDVPDISEAMSSVAIGSGGTRLAITKTYRVIKVVHLTLQTDGGTALTAKVVDKDISLGPLVECFNTSNALVTGHVDARIQGY